jgi:hypothetical protein
LPRPVPVLVVEIRVEAVVFLEREVGRLVSGIHCCASGSGGLHRKTRRILVPVYEKRREEMKENKIISTWPPEKRRKVRNGEGIEVVIAATRSLCSSI